MKHAGEEALRRLQPLLARIRALEGVREKARGIFYRGSSPFVHFHEDPAGLFGDVRDADGWTRFPVDTAAQRQALVARVRGLLTGRAPSRPPRGTRSRRSS